MSAMATTLSSMGIGSDLLLSHWFLLNSHGRNHNATAEAEIRFPPARWQQRWCSWDPCSWHKKGEMFLCKHDPTIGKLYEIIAYKETSCIMKMIMLKTLQYNPLFNAQLPSWVSWSGANRPLSPGRDTPGVCSPELCSSSSFQRANWRPETSEHLWEFLTPNLKLFYWQSWSNHLLAFPAI